MALKALSTKGITRRWLFNGLSVILAVLVIFEVAFALAMRAYIYSAVENALYVRASAQAVLLERQALTTSFDFEENAADLVENFTDKETMELQIVSDEAVVLMSSSGFSVSSAARVNRRDSSFKPFSTASASVSSALLFLTAASSPACAA